MRSTYKNLISFVHHCLLSFIGSARDKKPKRLTLRLVCVICATVILLTCATIATPATAVTHGTNDLCEQSIELNLSTEEAETTITLNGMMPQNATAAATDVTEDCAESGLIDGELETTSVIAAYDISINDGSAEFQPAEGYPIHVEISAPAIYDSGSIAILHITDDGTAETVEHFTVEDGKVSFYATGFSIYEIVEINNGNMGGDLAKTVAELTETEGLENGFVLYYDKTSPKFFTAELNGNNALIETTSSKQAAVWYFEEAGDYLKLYTYVNGVKKYLHNKSGNLVELSENKADLLDISEVQASPRPFSIKLSSANKWLQHSGSGTGIRYYTDNNNATNSRIFIKHASPEHMDVSAIEELTQKPYGLFHYSEGSTVGNALMAQGDTHSLVKLVLTAEGNHRILYVDENNEIDQWQFTFNSSDETFTVTVKDRKSVV